MACVEVFLLACVGDCRGECMSAVFEWFMCFDGQPDDVGVQLLVELAVQLAG